MAFRIHLILFPQNFAYILDVVSTDLKDLIKFGEIVSIGGLKVYWTS
jgi:hypothetical protein